MSIGFKLAEVFNNLLIFINSSLLNVSYRKSNNAGDVSTPIWWLVKVMLSFL